MYIQPNLLIKMGIFSTMSLTIIISLEKARYRAAIETDPPPIQCAVKETPMSKAFVSRIMHYVSDKILVGTLCPFMYLM